MREEGGVFHTMSYDCGVYSVRRYGRAVYHDETRGTHASSYRYRNTIPLHLDGVDQNFRRQLARRATILPRSGCCVSINTESFKLFKILQFYAFITIFFSYIDITIVGRYR